MDRLEDIPKYTLSLAHYSKEDLETTLIDLLMREEHLLSVEKEKVAAIEHELRKRFGSEMIFINGYRILADKKAMQLREQNNNTQKNTRAVIKFLLRAS